MLPWTTTFGQKKRKSATFCLILLTHRRCRADGRPLLPSFKFRNVQTCRLKMALTLGAQWSAMHPSGRYDWLTSSALTSWTHSQCDFLLQHSKILKTKTGFFPQKCMFGFFLVYSFRFFWLNLFVSLFFFCNCPLVHGNAAPAAACVGFRSHHLS